LSQADALEALQLNANWGNFGVCMQAVGKIASCACYDSFEILSSSPTALKTQTNSQVGTVVPRNAKHEERVSG
jgi:hypothetical protein